MEKIILKFFKASIILLFILTLSVGVVFAEDSNQTDAVGITSDDIVSSGDKTYNDLFNVINTSDKDNIQLNYDYTYNDSDRYGAMGLYNGNFTINGNNHFIDGNKQTTAFVLENSTVELNNLIIKNCNGSAIKLNNVVLKTNNVTFENNYAKEGTIYSMQSDYFSNSDRFIDNYAFEGSSILAMKSNINIDSSVFSTSKPITWSMIKGYSSIITVESSTFANSTSRYATAIFNDYITTIKKSKFINLHANATAGAVAVKGGNSLGEGTQTNIENSEFINTTSVKNAGAIFADIYGAYGFDGTVKILNSKFTDCVSEFGGAIVQLGGTLLVSSSNFTKNQADVDGGAIYASNATATIQNSRFVSNSADSSIGVGGALLLDYGDYIVKNSYFEKNTALKGGAILSYQSTNKVTGNEFSGNTEALHDYFTDADSKVSNNVYKTKSDVFKNYDETYFNSINYTGKQIVLNPTKINGSASDSYFNLKDLGLVTSVKNQGFMGACWAFGMIGAFESSFLIATGETLDLSENNLQNILLRYSNIGSKAAIEGGTDLNAISYFVSWLGVVNVEDDSYDELGKVSSIIFPENAYHAQNVLYIDPLNATEVKQALTTYGAMSLFIDGTTDSKYYNNKTHSLYYYGNGTGDHYVTLVGWNDTYSKDNFVETPEGDGAWICKNSWGTEWGDNGYFYISYYDKALKKSSAATFIFNNTDVYGTVYQNEFCGVTSYLSPEVGNTIKYGNVFKPNGDELITAVGTYFESAGEKYTVTIYIDGTEVYKQDGVSTHSGYETIKLNNNISVSKSNKFTVEIESKKMPFVASNRQELPEGTSYAIMGGKKTDLSFEYNTVGVKAYTVNNSLGINNIAQYYVSTKLFEVKSDLEGAVIEVSGNGFKKTATVTNGKASFNKVLPIGSYVLKITYNGTTMYGFAKILSRLTGNSNVNMYYFDGSVYKIRAKDSLGKFVGKNKVVTIKIGKTSFKVKTDANGWAKLKIPSKFTPGTYTITAKYAGQTVKNTLKVKQVLTSKKTVTVKKSAKKLVLKATLKKGKTVLKSKVVKFKVNGKTYTAKTNKKGIAQVTIKKSAINKLKAGKTYTVKVSYLTDVIKTTLKVKK